MEYKIDFKSNKTAAGRGVSSGAGRSGDKQEHTHYPEKENPVSSSPSQGGPPLPWDVLGPAQGAAERRNRAQAALRGKLKRVIKSRENQSSQEPEADP